MNISISYSHKKEWKEVVNYTTIVLELEENHKKALYYRIQANQNLMEVLYLVKISTKNQELTLIYLKKSSH